MNFKEVILKDGEDAVSPITIASSIYTKEGNPYTDHIHDDRYYTETEMDAKLKEKSNEGHNHDERYYTESEINSKVSAINTALAGKLKIGQYVTERIDITSNTTKTLPTMEVGEVSVFSYYLNFNADSEVSYRTKYPDSGKYFTLFAEPSVLGSGSTVNDRRIEIDMRPDWTGMMTDDVHDPIRWSKYTTWIYILIIRFA